MEGEGGRRQDTEGTAFVVEEGGLIGGGREVEKGKERAEQEGARRRAPHLHPHKMLFVHAQDFVHLEDFERLETEIAQRLQLVEFALTPRRLILLMLCCLITRHTINSEGWVTMLGMLLRSVNIHVYARRFSHIREIIPLS